MLVSAFSGPNSITHSEQQVVCKGSSVNTNIFLETKTSRWRGGGRERGSARSLLKNGDTCMLVLCI